MKPSVLAFAILAVQAQPAFEVASVRPSAANAPWGGIQITPGRFAAMDVSTRAILKEAFSVRDFQIVHAPDWFDTQRYEIIAKMEPAASESSIHEMLQNLLAERFRLEIHLESRDTQVYALTQAKNGTKLRPSKTDEKGRVSRKGSGIVAGSKATTQQLAEALSDVMLNGHAILDRPVIDRTGLSQNLYDFTLTWTPEPGQFGNTSTSDPSGPSLFTAIQEQLGLKLDTQKAQVEFLVIDRLEKATAN
jgi:uncharacterized protein (TIGR03435 family)